MKRLHSFLKLTVALGAASSAFAIDYTFSGSFQKDNDVTQFSFSVLNPSSVTVFSSSWDEGGFDPILAIWTGAGALIYEQDDGGNAGSTNVDTDGPGGNAPIAYSHGVWDSYYTVNLAAGNYIATVTQFSNFANSGLLSGGFQQDGNPNFTFDLGYGGATQPFFNGVWDSDDPRTGNYVFHLLNVDNATHQPPTVPEGASTVGLLAAAMAGVALLRRRQG
jgi:hypothetical protein